MPSVGKRPQRRATTWRSSIPCRTMTATIPKTRKSKSPGAADLDGAWLSQCIRSGGKNSKPLPVLANALIGIRAEWPDALAYDEMLCAPMLMQPLDGENDFTPRPLTDVDVGMMQDRLQHLGLKRIGKDTMHQAVDMRASERGFHPVRDYLDGLAWDGTPRMAKLFSDYFGAEPGPYVEAIGRMFSDQHGGAHLSSPAARPTTCR